MVNLILFKIVSETRITFSVVLRQEGEKKGGEGGGGGKERKKKRGLHPTHLSFVELPLSSAEAAQEILVQACLNFFFSLTNYCSVLDLILVFEYNLSNFTWNAKSNILSKEKLCQSYP